MDVKCCCLFQTLNATTDLETTLEKPVGPLTALFFFNKLEVQKKYFQSCTTSHEENFFLWIHVLR